MHGKKSNFPEILTPLVEVRFTVYTTHPSPLMLREMGSGSRYITPAGTALKYGVIDITTPELSMNDTSGVGFS